LHEIIEVATAVKALGAGDPTLIRAFSPAPDPNVAPPHWRADTGAEGRFLVHLFVDEEPPVSMATYLRERRRIDRMLVPSGRLLLAGEEAFYGTESDGLGREVLVEPGEYDMVACRCHAPPDLIDRRFGEQATPAQREAWTLVRTLGWVSLVGSVVAVAAAWMLERRVGVLAALVPLALIAGIIYIRSRYAAGEAYQSAETLRAAIRRDLPHFALVMHRRDPAAPLSS
jgi:hypothetical protein